MCKQFEVRSACAHQWMDFSRSAHAQGGRTKLFSIVNFSKSSRTIQAQLFILFFKYRWTTIFRQFFFKICKTDVKIFFKIPIFDIFVGVQKALLQIFVLTCKNVYFDPKFKRCLNGWILSKTFSKNYAPVLWGTLGHLFWATLIKSMVK